MLYWRFIMFVNYRQQNLKLDLGVGLEKRIGLEETQSLCGFLNNVDICKPRWRAEPRNKSCVLSLIFWIALFAFHSIYLVVCVCECRDFVDLPLDISKHITKKFGLSLMSRRSSCWVLYVAWRLRDIPRRFRAVSRRFRDLLIRYEFNLLIIFRNAYSTPLADIKVLSIGIRARLSILGLTALRDDVDKWGGISRTSPFRWFKLCILVH